MLSQSADSFRLCNGCKRFLIKSGGHKLGYQSVLISNKKSQHYKQMKFYLKYPIQ